MGDVDGRYGGVLFGAECDEAVAPLRPSEFRGFHIRIVVLLHRVYATEKSDSAIPRRNIWDFR